MFKRTVLISLITSLVGLTFILAAQIASPSVSSAWFVSLYDQAGGTITRVLPTGAASDPITLPISEGFDSYGFNVVTSPSKNLIAYFISQVGDGTSPVEPTQLKVYDVAGQSLRVSYDLDVNVGVEGVNTAGTSLRFNDDGSHIITGYYVQTQDKKFEMEIIALDTSTGQVTNTLNSEALAPVGVKANTAYYTEVIAFSGDMATLVLRPIPPNMSDQPLALNWNVTANEVTLGPQVLVNATDYFPSSNEALLVNYGGNPIVTVVPQETPEPQTLPSRDTVQIFSLNSSEPQTIYHEDSNLVSAKFVQNGLRILVFADSGGRGILIERDGTLVKEFANLPGDSFTFGIPEGFVYSDPQKPGTLVVVRTDDNSFTPDTLYTAAAPFTSISVEATGANSG